MSSLFDLLGLAAFLLLPSWRWVFLSVATLLGFVVGSFNTDKNQLLAWFLVSNMYGVLSWLSVLAASAIHGGSDLDLFGWRLVIPSVIFSLPAVGIPWAIARSFHVLRNRR